MADQKKITLRQGHATPKNIILRELPVADALPTTKIYLYQGHATAKNIILDDPTVIREAAGGGANFAGIATVTFSQTGAFRSAAKFVGTSSIEFSQTGTFKAATKLAGTSTINLSATGDFVAGPAVAAGANFAGDATIDFSASASFSAGPAIQVALGNIGPWRTDEQERRRMKRFREEAEDELRKSIEALVRGDKPLANKLVESALEKVEIVKDYSSVPELREIRHELLALKSRIRKTEIVKKKEIEDRYYDDAVSILLLS